MTTAPKSRTDSPSLTLRVTFSNSLMLETLVGRTANPIGTWIDAEEKGHEQGCAASADIARKGATHGVRASEKKSASNNSVAPARKVPAVAAKKRSKSASPSLLPAADSYQHAEPKAPLRPEVGTQSQFKAKKPPTKFKYDSSLSPELEWDGGNAAREQAEASIAALQSAVAILRRQISEISFENDKESNAQKDALEQTLAEAEAALAKLKSLSKPFLNWTGKGEKQ